MGKQKLNCWEVMKCGKETEGDDCFFSEEGTCPASTELYMDGVNEGKNAGRACWAIAGTLCGDEIQGDSASKMKTCMECEFYRQVQKKEGEKFITGSELMEMVQYQDQILQSKLDREERKPMKLKKSALIEKLVIEMDNFTDGETSNKVRTEIARDTVNLFFNSIKESLAAGDRVELRGFGSFNVKEYDGYSGRNPKTGAKVEVQPKKSPVFRSGRELRSMVDKK